MKFLKQGICLALLGAGLSAAPLRWPQSRGVPSPSRPGTTDHGLVQQIRMTPMAPSRCRHHRTATGKVGFAAVRHGKTCCPVVAGDRQGQASAKAGPYLDEVRRRVRRRAPTSSAQ